MATEEKAIEVEVEVEEEEEDDDDEDEGFVAERIVSNAPHGGGDSAKAYDVPVPENYEVRIWSMLNLTK